LGSYALPGNFFDPLRRAGAEVRLFNPIAVNRFSIRNHRKLLVCDEHVAFVGGYNIAPEYEGDGVTCGWCDIGLKIVGSLAKQLASSFDEMFARADFRHKRFMRFRRFDAKKSVTWPTEQILFSGPGRGQSPIKRALHKDLARAKDVKIIVAYFLPTWRLRRELTRRLDEIACEILAEQGLTVDSVPGHGATFRHEVRDERELPDELLGVLRHRRTKIRPRTPRWAVRCRTRPLVPQIRCEDAQGREICHRTQAACTVRPS